MNPYALLRSCIAILIWCFIGTLGSAYQNPIISDHGTYGGPGDPGIYYENGVYYLIPSYSEGTQLSQLGFWCWTSKDLVHWTKQGRIYAAGTQSVYKYFFVGPVCLKKANGYYYMFYIASNTPPNQDDPNSPYWPAEGQPYHDEYKAACLAGQRICVARSEIDNNRWDNGVLGPYEEFKAPLVDINALTGCILSDAGNDYFYFTPLNIGTQNISVQQLSFAGGDVALTGTRYDNLATPIQDWEIDARHSWAINEWPMAFKRGDQIYVLYAGNNVENKEYATGYMVSSSPIGSFVKHEGPILHELWDSTESHRVFAGSGGASYVTSPDGKEEYIIYARHEEPDIVSSTSRVICIDRLGFTDAEDPVTNAQSIFVVGPSTGTEQPNPFSMLLQQKSLFRPALASATWNPYEPSCAVDARMDTAWASGPVYYSAWLNVELEPDGFADQAVNNIEIVWYPAHYATEYKVRAKGTLDSEFYTLLDAQNNECHYTGQTGGYKRIDLPANTRIRNLRIECISANGFEGYVIQELRANQSNSIRVSNQANCTASASSVFGENPPSNAVLDSDNSLHWESDHGAANSPESIIIDLGAQKNIDCINIDWGSGYAAAFAIYIDPGGVQPDNFLKIASVSNNASKSTLHELPCPIAARHVKIACTQNGGGLLATTLSEGFGYMVELIPFPTMPLA